MDDIIKGAFKFVIFSDVTESDARYGYDGEPYRWTVNVWFKDPENFYLPCDNEDGRTLIKSKMVDGNKKAVMDWIEEYSKIMLDK